MKNIIVLVFVMFASFSMTAQNRFEKAAKETVTTMAGVIDMTSEQQKQIYDIELVVNTKRAEIRQENAGNQSVIQEKLKELYSDSNEKTKESLGAVKFKTWVDYRKAQREKN